VVFTYRQQTFIYITARGIQPIFLPFLVSSCLALFVSILKLFDIAQDVFFDYLVKKLCHMVIEKLNFIGQQVSAHVSGFGKIFGFRVSAENARPKTR